LFLKRRDLKVCKVEEKFVLDFIRFIFKN